MRNAGAIEFPVDQDASFTSPEGEGVRDVWNIWLRGANAEHDLVPARCIRIASKSGNDLILSEVQVFGETHVKKARKSQEKKARNASRKARTPITL